jgi:hypothetical protein
MSASILLFILLGFLVSIEASTSISRKSGYMINNPSTGFVFQSSLSLVSRAVIFMFMPLLGYLADKNELLKVTSDILYLYSFIPISLFLLYIIRYKLEKVYMNLLHRMNIHGSFFKSIRDENIEVIKFKKIKSLKKTKYFKKLYLIFLLSYIPYYLAWPIIIILLTIYNDNRAMILGMSSVFNGINTIIITLFIDPKLTQLGKYNRLIQYVYNDLVLLRFYASMIAYFILLLFVLGVSVVK